MEWGGDRCDTALRGILVIVPDAQCVQYYKRGGNNLAYLFPSVEILHHASQYIPDYIN